MSSIDFDDGAADGLIRSARDASAELRGQGAGRRAAAEDASTDFAGAYADRFLESVKIEATDRPKLAGVLDDLADQVERAKTKAAGERERQRDLAAWAERDEQRRRTAADALIPASALPVAYDPKPSEKATIPSTLEAAFTAHKRTRTGGGTGHGRSSADPVHLRAFAASSRIADDAAQSTAEAVATALSRFRSSCTWTPVGNVSLVQGFEQLLEENRADSAWVTRIAEAFERAGGGGALANTSMDSIIADDISTELRALLADDLTPTQVAARWDELGFTRDDAAGLSALPTSVLRVLGNLEGVPYWARSCANVSLLDRRIASARAFLDDLDRPGRVYSPEARRDAENLTALESIKDSLLAGTGRAPRSLILLSEDEPPLAGVSIGDLDTASNVTVSVPGMNSSSEKMFDWVDASQHVYDEQARVGGPTDRAVVAWMGYKSPALPVGNLDVLHSDRAKAGGPKLASMIRGLDATRSGDMPTVNVLAHSYGSTTAAYALAEEGVHVDTFTTIASAGIPDSLPTADDVHTDHFYAGQARNVWAPSQGTIPFIGFGQGDQYAVVGRNLSEDHHIDPTSTGFGATPFGADGSDGLSGVTDHGVHVAGDTGYLDRGTESLQNVAFATTGQPEQLTAYHRHDLDFEDALLGRFANGD
ncbi:alpha/beta hydrolase [Curtobacterium sp. MCBD17_021]|uniref:alpha/beta hydrolase n=1 Tax=Curtobacterium sp. MCBD17_021 TaxID=2175665 RepID=UPI0015E87C7B|nr:alpha/beta hydrolase [Curtobacterium sp. MCBD17_021]